MNRSLLLLTLSAYAYAQSPLAFHPKIQCPKVDIMKTLPKDDPLDMAKQFFPHTKFTWVEEKNFFTSYSGVEFYERGTKHGRISLGVFEYDRNRYRWPGQMKVNIPKQPYRILEGTGGMPRQYDSFVLRLQWEPKR